MATITEQRIDAAVVCGCGQDLDDCQREHCPRCGRAVPHYC
jgi:hypothetical protein